MGHSLMFFEIERLAREELLEVAMVTEKVRCSQCGRKIPISAEEGQEVFVKCPCGHKMIVVIEKRAA